MTDDTPDSGSQSESDAQTDDRRAIVLLSGGVDSATAAHEARERGYDVCALHATYGQRTADREFECARRLADDLDARDFLRVETGHLAAVGASSLTDEGMAVADADLASEEIPDTYVPFRNANLLAMAVSYAEANGCDAVFVGAHGGDFAGYPDCRPAFFEAFERVVDAGTRPETGISIEAPFVEASKTDVVARGVALDVSFEHTWSCYRADEPACGTCDSCALRLRAFRNVGVRDPIPYAERPNRVDGA